MLGMHITRNALLLLCHLFIYLLGNGMTAGEQTPPAFARKWQATSNNANTLEESSSESINIRLDGKSLNSSVENVAPLATSNHEISDTSSSHNGTTGDQLFDGSLLGIFFERHLDTQSNERAETTTVTTESALSHSAPLTPWILPPPELNGSSSCNTDSCQLWNPCDSDQVCVVTTECMIDCWRNDSSSLVSTDPPTDDLLIMNGTTTLRPWSERSCNNSPITCIHGKASNCSLDKFYCVCDDGWVGDTCKEPCTLSCVHGQCQTGPAMFCNCQHNYRGDTCEELIPDPGAKQRILAAVLSAALAVVVIVTVVIPIVMWKMRVILVFKLVHFFSDYEDNDGKTFDAYVSMTPTSNAEAFVYHSLRPMLEDKNFKLYLQARDSQPGQVMSEIILSAVEKSRRTIMIITRDYITNEWNRFEYLIAQHETLKLKQKIIPIILEDIDQDTNNLDKSLKHILASFKCIKFPELEAKKSITNESSKSCQSPNGSRSPDSSTCLFQPGISTASVAVTKEEKVFQKKMDKFWKRLLLTMPKKNKTQVKTSNFLAKVKNHTSYNRNTDLSKNGQIVFNNQKHKKQSALESRLN